MSIRVQATPEIENIPRPLLDSYTSPFLKAHAGRPGSVMVDSALSQSRSTQLAAGRSLASGIRACSSARFSRDVVPILAPPVDLICVLHILRYDSVPKGNDAGAVPDGFLRNSTRVSERLTSSTVRLTPVCAVGDPCLIG